MRRPRAAATAVLLGVATRMPAFSITLSENDRWDLVNYLRASWPGRPK